MVQKTYYQYYEDMGYFFDRSVLTTYALSLYSKPFVILSGISGTGKTKIAQFFSVPATRSGAIPHDRRAPQVPPPDGQHWAVMTVRDGVIKGDGRANLQYKDLGVLLTDAEIEAIKPRIDALKAAGNEGNISELFDFVIETPGGEELTAMAYLQRASNPLFRVRFKSKRGEPHYDSTPYFAEHHAAGDVLRLEKTGNRRLRIVSINDEAVVQHAHDLAVTEQQSIKNSCFISVRSDWTDATAMFGYYNFVEQKYNITPLVSFILQAHDNPGIPFFLILDEMNLSKVEHYFSDFLSALESRYQDAEGRWQQEPVRLHSAGSWVESNDDYFDLIPTALTIPPNFFVTGTVNIDESTYMFSPKVLDRANVIELNDVDLENYGKPSAQREVEGDSFLLERFPPFHVPALPTYNDYLELDESVRDMLRSVHRILSEHQLHFGYRVANEVSAYIKHAKEFCKDSPGYLDTALDFQLVQKILPKLSGSQSRLEAPVQKLLALLTGHDSDAAMVQLLREDAQGTRFPRAVKKLQRMAGALSAYGFATYIE